MACPICFGGDDLVVRDSLNAGIAVLMGVTVVVLAAFARFIVRLMRRATPETRRVTDLKWEAAWRRVSQPQAK